MMRQEQRALAWDHGVLAAQRLGGMLGPVTFLIDGKPFSPLHVAPWGNEPERTALPGILQRLRGEWPCVPFGYSAPREAFPPEWQAVMFDQPTGEEIHGHSSNHNWEWTDAPAGSLAMQIRYPEMSDVIALERTITPDPNSAAIDIDLVVHVRRPCRLPIGLHPCFRLPERPGAARFVPAPFDHGLTYPVIFEPGSTALAPNARFKELTAVPGISGAAVDVTRLPFADQIEELVQLNLIDGHAALENLDEGYRVSLTWQKEHFPSLLLWISNHGRGAAPWNHRHLGLGIEPLCSTFGLAVATSLADNPIARSGTPTALTFERGTPFRTRYRISLQAL